MSEPQVKWSFSRWEAYAKCPRYFKFRYIDKRPEPDNKYATRGTDLHQAAEDFVAGKTSGLPVEFAHHHAEITRIRDEIDNPQLEYEVALDKDWNLTSWRSSNAWVRMKLDVYYNETIDKKGNIQSTVIDYKSGSIKEHHVGQLQLYAIAGLRVAAHYGVNITGVSTKLFYIDKNETSGYIYNAAHENVLITNWTNKIEALMNDTDFVAKTGHYCKWCHYRKSNKGPCKYG